MPSAPLLLPRVHPSRACLQIAILCAVIGTHLVAHGQSVQSLADAEVARRTRLVGDSSLQLKEAAVLFDAGKTEESLQLYKSTYESLPDVVMASSARSAAREGYAIVGVARARELAKEGHYKEAKALLDEILSPEVAPKDEDATKFRSELANPDRWPPALTPEHIANVNQVSDLLWKAHSAREIGDYDRSNALYADVLRIDPHNTAARRGMEAVERHKSEYFDSARDHTRSKMLGAVDQTWEDELPVRDVTELFGEQDTNLYRARQGGREALTDKLRTLRLSSIDFSGASLDETIEYLRVRSRDLDPTGQGIDFVVSVPEETRARTVTLNLVDVPFDEALRYMTDAAGATYRVEEHAIRIITLSQDSSTIISKVYRVPPGFIQSTPMAADAGNDPFGTASGNTGTGLELRRMNAQEFLATRGVVFGEGTGASFNASTNVLIVRNTPAQLQTIDMLVEQSATAAPKQVRLDVRMVQVAEADLKELGFDWLLGPFNVNSSNNVGNGGTIGNQNLAGNFAVSQFVPLPFAPALGNPVTAGLRSSNDITSSNRSIDAVLAGSPFPTQNRPPGVLSLSGAFTQPQFQVIMRGLDQRKGVDVMTAPSVIAKSGQAVSVRGIREMLYPTEFDPPQIPTITPSRFFLGVVGAPPFPGGYFYAGTFGIVDAAYLGFTPPGGAIIGPLGTAVPVPAGILTGITTPVVPPSTPTAFEKREIGTILEAEAVISEDGKAVELNISTELSEFDGFIDYGTPYQLPTFFYPDLVAGTPIYGPNQFSLYLGSTQPNTMVQPIFSSKKANTGVKIWDGSTIVIAGLMKEETTTINDGVPLLQDIPYAGRLFQTKIEEKRQSNLLIFVTVNVLDPSGKKLNQTTASAQ